MEKCIDYEGSNSLFTITVDRFLLFFLLRKNQTPTLDIRNIAWSTVTENTRP